MDPAELELRGWRNAAFPGDEIQPVYLGAPIDLTDRTYRMQVRRYGGESGTPLIDLETAASATAEGVWPIDEAEGVFRVQIEPATMQAAYDAVATEIEAGARAELVYDLIATDPDGFTFALIEGAFIIEPGVTL